jgi:hypothetical protein
MSVTEDDLPWLGGEERRTGRTGNQNKVYEQLYPGNRIKSVRGKGERGHTCK